ncbi:YorP protein [Pseudanabaena phage Pan5]|nr:YorP protein [Pseudanabaena phage Pan5]
MKYKVGDIVKVVAKHTGPNGRLPHLFKIGSIVEVFEIDEEDNTYRCFEKSKPLNDNWLIESEMQLISEPNYRALYEQEKELRQALEAYMSLTEKTYSGNPMEKVHLAHYQQLKQQYNGQDTGTAQK